MDIFEKKMPLKVTHPIGGVRITDDIFKTENGLCFFDIGWLDITSNPQHYLQGQITGEGPWQIGETTIEVLQPEDPEYKYYNEWLQVKRTFAITEERVKEILSRKIEGGATDASSS